MGGWTCWKTSLAHQNITEMGKRRSTGSSLTFPLLSACRIWQFCTKILGAVGPRNTQSLEEQQHPSQIQLQSPKHYNSSRRDEEREGRKKTQCRFVPEFNSPVSPTSQPKSGGICISPLEQEVSKYFPQNNCRLQDHMAENVLPLQKRVSKVALDLLLNNVENMILPQQE